MWVYLCWFWRSGVFWERPPFLFQCFFGCMISTDMTYFNYRSYISIQLFQLIPVIFATGIQGLPPSGRCTPSHSAESARSSRGWAAKKKHIGNKMFQMFQCATLFLHLFFWDCFLEASEKRWCDFLFWTCEVPESAEPEPVLPPAPMPWPRCI